MSILQNDEFWRLVYPNDSPETVVKRQTHLLDLYLNMQDKVVSTIRNTVFVCVCVVCVCVCVCVCVSSVSYLAYCVLLIVCVTRLERLH